jgi:hypothetical protein
MNKKRRLTDRVYGGDRFCFCDDLDAPEILVILDQRWATANREQILGSPGVQSLQADSSMLIIPNEQDRLLFMLKFA